MQARLLECPLRSLLRLRGGRTARRGNGCYGNQQRAASFNCQEFGTFAGGKGKSRARALRILGARLPPGPG